MFVYFTVAPVCRPGQKTIYSGGRQETIKVLCELEANPHNVTFNWKFNASSTEFLDLPASQIFPERSNAVAQYTPMTEHVSKERERVLIQSACYHSFLLLFMCVVCVFFSLSPPFGRCKSSHKTQWTERTFISLQKSFG